MGLLWSARLGARLAIRPFPACRFLVAMYGRVAYLVRTMPTIRKKLTRTGNSIALVLDREILAASGIDVDKDVEVSVHGDSIVVCPARSSARKKKLAEIVADAHHRYGPVFKKLAE